MADRTVTRHSSGYGEAEIKFASGHKLVDNKRGDFDFVCPVGGILFFLPIMIGHTLDASKACPHCGAAIGEIHEPT